MAAAEREVATEIESSDRSIRDDIVASMKEVEESQSPPEPKEEPKAERVRDETGKFAKTQEQPEPESPEAAVPTTPAASQPQAPAFTAAPSSWSNAAKAKWAALDPELRAEIGKREADVHKGFTKMDDERQFAKEMKTAVAPYEAFIRATGATPAQVVQSTFNALYRLRTGDENTKLQTVAQICHDYGIDASRLTNSQQQQADPTIAALQQEVAQLRGQQQQQIYAQQNAEQQQVQSAIEAFGQDPKHPHFQAVQVHMGALMQAGEAKTMDEAYEMAVWARPDLRAQQLSEREAQLKQKTVAKAQQARAKSVSVRGGPGGSMPAGSNPNSSVREDLMAALQEAQGRI